jgi:hypothetical protein
MARLSNGVKEMATLVEKPLFFILKLRRIDPWTLN